MIRSNVHVRRYQAGELCSLPRGGFELPLTGLVLGGALHQSDCLGKLSQTQMRFAPCDSKPEIFEQRRICIGQRTQRVAHALANGTRALAAEKIEYKGRVDGGIALIELNAEIHAL